MGIGFVGAFVWESCKKLRPRCIPGLSFCCKSGCLAFVSHLVQLCLYLSLLSPFPYMACNRCQTREENYSSHWFNNHDSCSLFILIIPTGLGDGVILYSNICAFASPRWHTLS